MKPNNLSLVVCRYLGFMSRKSTAIPVLVGIGFMYVGVKVIGMLGLPKSILVYFVVHAPFGLLVLAGGSYWIVWVILGAKNAGATLQSLTRSREFPKNVEVEPLLVSNLPLIVTLVALEFLLFMALGLVIGTVGVVTFLNSIF